MPRDRMPGGAPRFHCAVPLGGSPRITLPADVFHHAVRVRRLRAGDELVLFAGDGFEARAKLTDVGRDSAQIEVLQVDPVDRESPLPITLLQGISSGDRMDYTLQKAVELGVTAIVPVTAERSIVRLQGERADKRAAHWRETVVSACEQCGRNRLPEVFAAMPLGTALAMSEATSTRFMLAIGGTRRLGDVDRPADGRVVLLAGPEGGLSPVEQRAALQSGFVPLSLGPRVLRTETAAVAAIAAMQALWGDG
jgi:16S rRNA (uracil1498-N3)-methyltransferase